MADPDSSALSSTDAAAAYYRTVDSQLDIPLVSLRVAPAPSPVDETTPLDDALNAPLVTLRAPGANAHYLSFPRPSSPVLTEPADSDDDGEEELEYIEGSEERFRAANSVSDVGHAPETEPHNASIPAASSGLNAVQDEGQNTALPPSSSTRSMTGQTLRSFESRPHAVLADSDAAPAVAAKSPKKKKTTRASSSLSLSGSAPSDAGLYNLIGLIAPPAKKEVAADLKERNEENNRRLITWLLTLQKTVEDNRKAQIKQEQEFLRRFADFQIALNSESPSLNQNVTADIAHMKQLMVNARESISRVTECVNNLVDIPVELAGLQRAVDTLRSGSGPAHTSMSATTPAPSHTVAPTMRSNPEPPRSAPAAGSQAKRGGSAGEKRNRVFEPVEEPEPKRHHAEGDMFHFDVFLWHLKTQFANPYNTAQMALDALKMPRDGLVSALRPHGYPKTLISMRFNDEQVARTFMDRLRTNPPKDMAHLKVATPAAYGKLPESETGYKKKAGKTSGSNDNKPCLNITAWNIHGRLAIKIADPEFIDLILDHDIVIFQETFLRIGEERTLELPRGYEIVAKSRPDRPGLLPAWGGVAAVIKSTIKYSVSSSLSAPDLLVLDLEDMFVIGAYLLPGTSEWREWTDVDPAIRYREAVTACSLCPDKPLIGMGDINARVANRTPRGSALSRSSLDDIINTRGRWLLRLCGDNGLTILNGTVKEIDAPGAFTSFQPLGSTVIDFVIASAGMLPRIRDRSIRITKALEWSDHAQLEVEVTDVQSRSYGSPRVKLKPTFIEFGPPTELDLLAQKALKAALPPDEAIKKLFGPVRKSGHPVSVYIASTSRGQGSNCVAVFALYWGPNNGRNVVCKAEGNASDSRATLFGILMALMRSTDDKTLTIFSSSQYAIRSFCYWAADNANRGWSCNHSDVLQATVQRIAHRAAPVVFRYVAATAVNANMQAARVMAKDGMKHANIDTMTLADLADSESDPSIPARQDSVCGLDPELDLPKVSTSLPELSEPKLREVPQMSVDDIIDPDDCHRGRDRERKLLYDNMIKLLSCKTNLEFWTLLRKWTDDRYVEPAVTPAQLHDSFKARLNPPDSIPEHFDAELNDIITGLADTIPRRTTDRTTQGFFSRPITEKDIARIKVKLRKKSFRSAKGIDDVSYSKIMTIPNDVLVELFNTCIDKCDAPQRWLVTILIGILKQGRAVDDPESYRLVGLECCLLKILTLLFDGRLREWADANGVIPESQNGFQPGRRTDDNCFILICAIARARAEGKPLFVFFGDMTNAFPYTDVARLWVDMYAAGVSGPFFDWMRMVYARMVYATKYGDEHCLPFRSVIGLLTGDSASPCLWNIYFADFQLREHPDDVRLHGRALCQAEQADDNIIMSTSFPAFQEKVAEFFCWCKNKRVFISARKSKWMIFGLLPHIIPILRLGDLCVELVSQFKYVGIWLTSTTPNIFSLNYSIKASKARNASNAIFAMKHRIGSLPPKEGLQLYMARVDCYLISAAEISIDVDAHLIDEYLEVQHLFVRRLLGINSRSMLAVLFTETGLMPIRIRRLLQALARARYMATLGDERHVRWAMLDSLDLFTAGHPGWAADIAILLRSLPTPIRIVPADFLCAATIDAISKKVVEVVDADLQFDIDNLQKTHLLRNRLESVEDKKLALVTRRRRHYLTMVPVPAHRKALTRLLLSDHNLSVERLRYPARHRLPIPRDERLCRFCRRDVEDEVHALLECDAYSPLVALRDTFLEDAFQCDSALEAAYQLLPRYDFLHRVLSSRKAVKRFAKFVHEVLGLFDGFERYIPVGYYRV